MSIFRSILFIGILLLPRGLPAQVSDNFAGTWQMEYRPAGKSVIRSTLQVALPERGVLYPARLEIKTEGFSGSYNLLLVKKNNRQLAVGRNKIAIEESPFSLGNWPAAWNGNLNLGISQKGTYFLYSEKMPAKKYGLPMPDLKNFEVGQVKTASMLQDFMLQTELGLEKINDSLPRSLNAEEILKPGKNPDYYGIVDSIFTNERDVALEFPGNKKAANGVVSVMLNGNLVIDQATLDYTRPRDEIRLDTGMNILVFITNSYGRSTSTTGKLKLGFRQKNIVLDFDGKDDIAATFIIAKIFYTPPVVPGFNENDDLTRIYEGIIMSNPDSPTRFSNGKIDTARTPNIPAPGSSHFREAHEIGSMTVTSRQLVFAIWDDAVEDGDSISLTINGKWIVQGLAVKKKPQFIAVDVLPGPNKITFIADNLGSIIPNTSVLEIIDRKERKSFMINTDLGNNNLINIYYDIRR